MLNRKNLRIPGYNYRSSGYYFITFCTEDRLALFGDVTNGKMILNDAGRMVHTKIGNTPHYYPDIHIDIFVVMPDHVHALVVLDGFGRTQRLRDPSIFYDPSPADNMAFLNSSRPSNNSDSLNLSNDSLNIWHPK